MLRSTMLCLVLFSLVLGACASATETPAVEPLPTSEPTQPELVDETPYPPPIDFYTQPVYPYPGEQGAEGMERGEVFIDSTEVVIRESLPAQAVLTVKGNLPTPCHHVSYVVNEPDDQNRIMVEIFSLVDPAVLCTQVLEPFEEQVELGSLTSGKYSVWVNGEQVTEFEV